MKRIFQLLFVSAVMASCSSNDGSTPSDSYSRTALLTNWADNIIVPSYQNYQQKLADLSVKTEAFTANPDASKLETLRASWLEAYKAYQHVALFKTGKAEELYLKETANTFPTDVQGIEANVASGVYDLSQISQFSKQGFPALDYLLYGIADSDSQIVEVYATSSDADSYRSYLLTVSARLKSTADAVVADWTGSYRDTFVSSTGNTVSSSVNRTVNNFIQFFEKDVRTAKIGIPAGVFSNGVLYANKTEAFHGGNISKILLNEAVEAAKNFFNGKHFGSNVTGESLKSYLDHVNAVRSGQNLSDVINVQFNAIDSVSAALQPSLADQVLTDNSKMLTMYDALQQNVIYLKLDMMQSLNITIDYVDSDGD